MPAEDSRAHVWVRGVPVVAVSGDNTEYSKAFAQSEPERFM